MDEQSFQDKFADLMSRIQKLPDNERRRLEHIAEEARRRRRCLQASVAQLQDSLDHLRLTIKYLVFDLEATRRENKYLRQLVEQANREDTPQSGQDQDDQEGEGAGSD